MKGSSHHPKLEEKVQKERPRLSLNKHAKHGFLRKIHNGLCKKPVKETSSGSTGGGRYQKLEQPEAGLVIASLEGIDEEEEKQAIQGERISLHGYQDATTEEAGQQADTPQHTQQTCNLHKHTHTFMETDRYFFQSARISALSFATL